MVDPLLRSLQDSHHAQGHVALALKMMRVLQDVKCHGVKMQFCPDDWSYIRLHQNDQLGSFWQLNEVCKQAACD